MLEKEVFIDVEGDKHVLEFSIFHGLPEDIDVVIIDIALKAKNRSGKYGLRTMHRVVQECVKYLEDNDVVLYYICDRSEIDRSDLSISPQAFRHSLFQAHIGRIQDNRVYIGSIEIEGEYITLMGFQHRQKDITECMEYINEMRDK